MLPDAATCTEWPAAVDAKTVTEVNRRQAPAPSSTMDTDPPCCSASAVLCAVPRT
jgi:hypothetical protein